MRRYYDGPLTEWAADTEGKCDDLPPPPGDEIREDEEAMKRAWQRQETQDAQAERIRELGMGMGMLVWELEAVRAGHTTPETEALRQAKAAQQELRDPEC